MSYEDLPCNEFVELVTDYLEGALATERQVEFEWHLAFCEPCVDYVVQYRSGIAAAAELRQADNEVSDPVLDHLLQAFRDVTGTSGGAAEAGGSADL